jgi:hypothetical protein
MARIETRADSLHLVAARWSIDRTESVDSRDVAILTARVYGAFYIDVTVVTRRSPAERKKWLTQSRDRY